jgi:hypothetical protein
MTIREYEQLIHKIELQHGIDRRPLGIFIVPTPESGPTAPHEPFKPWNYLVGLAIYLAPVALWIWFVLWLVGRGGHHGH